VDALTTTHRSFMTKKPYCIGEENAMKQIAFMFFVLLSSMLLGIEDTKAQAACPFGKPYITYSPATAVSATRYEFSQGVGSAQKGAADFMVTAHYYTSANTTVSASPGVVWLQYDTSVSGSKLVGVANFTDPTVAGSLCRADQTALYANITNQSNNAPTFTSTPASTNVTVGSSYSYTPTAQDADGDPTSFTLAGTPPPGLVWTSGVLAGTFTTAGNWSVVITLSDGRGGTATQTLAFTVSNPTPIDSDGDGVQNHADQCPNTPQGEGVNTSGCSDSQLDDDGDGVTNDIDQCPNTPTGAAVTNVGCSLSQLDSDGDGVDDSIDECPNTPAGTTVNAVGCAIASGNNPPVVTVTGNNGSYAFGERVEITLFIRDSDGDVLVLDIDSVPLGMNFTEIGNAPGSKDFTLTGVPLLSGEYVIRISVSDGSDTISLNVRFTVGIPTTGEGECETSITGTSLTTIGWEYSIECAGFIFDSARLIGSTLPADYIFSYSRGGEVATVKGVYTHPTTYNFVAEFLSQREVRARIHFFVSVVSGVDTEEEGLPMEFALLGNYPNPFNPTTTIEFTLPDASGVQIRVVNMLGEEVWDSSDSYTPGTHHITFDAGGLPSGMYLYTIRSESGHYGAGSMTLLK